MNLIKVGPSFALPTCEAILILDMPLSGSIYSKPSMQQGLWIILNYYIGHFCVCDYVILCVIAILYVACQGTAEKQYFYTEQSSL